MDGYNNMNSPTFIQQWLINGQLLVINMAHDPTCMSSNCEVGSWKGNDMRYSQNDYLDYIL